MKVPPLCVLVPVRVSVPLPTFVKLPLCVKAPEKVVLALLAPTLRFTAAAVVLQGQAAAAAEAAEGEGVRADRAVEDDPRAARGQGVACKGSRCSARAGCRR